MTAVRMTLVAAAASALVSHPAGRAAAVSQATELSIRLVGNAGVSLSDGTTSVMVDLPYEPGAFGYMHYDPDALRPVGATVSVITHHHDDHFDAGLFLSRPGWRIIGPPSVTARLPLERVLSGDSVTVGAFTVIAIQSPHTDDHRSYRIRWRGRVLHFTGDTENSGVFPAEPRPDILFATPWFNCSIGGNGASRPPRVVLYHLLADGSDRICGQAEVHVQGTELRLGAVTPPRS